MRLGKVRLQLQRSLITCRGFVRLALTHENITQVVVHLGVARFQLQRSLITRHGLIEIPTVAPGEPQVVVHLGVVGPQLQRSLITRNGLVELSQVLPGVSQVELRLGPIGSERQSTPDALDSGLRIADVTSDEPKQVPRIVVIRVNRKNLPVNRLRLAQSAHPLMLNERWPELRRSWAWLSYCQ